MKSSWWADSCGIRWTMSQGRKFDSPVFGEPSGAPKITKGYRGRVALKVVTMTDGGHASSPWANRSAFVSFVRLTSELKSYEETMTIPGDHFRSLSIAPTIARSGRFHNVLPNRCDATLDVLVPPGLTTAKVAEGIALIARLNGSAEVTVEDATEPYQAPPGSTLLRAFQSGTLTSTGSKPAFVKKTGTGDMNTFSSGTRAECITYGPGTTVSSHADSESVRVGDSLQSVRAVSQSLSELRRLSRGGAS